MFTAGLEPATFRVLGGRDNHYTTKTMLDKQLPFTKQVVQYLLLYLDQAIFDLPGTASRGQANFRLSKLETWRIFKAIKIRSREKYDKPKIGRF